jgi:hypothetical protein
VRVDDLHAGQPDLLAFAVVLDRERAGVVHRDDAHHPRLRAHRQHEGENEGDSFHLRLRGAEDTAIARPQDADSGVERGG